MAPAVSVSEVSVLFSEPKIPQTPAERMRAALPPRFSALQRAENSSNANDEGDEVGDNEFQCSSASRKFLKRFELQCRNQYADSFSALQRAENSSNDEVDRRAEWLLTFQCSSASRKFLKTYGDPSDASSALSFSALQRAENSSRRAGDIAVPPTHRFSALQRAENSSTCLCAPVSPISRVSVLFSEPKIPQPSVADNAAPAPTFQCSSASRKFLKLHGS